MRCRVPRGEEWKERVVRKGGPTKIREKMQRRKRGSYIVRGRDDPQTSVSVWSG